MLRIQQQAVTFDDVLLVPGYSEVIPSDVSLHTQLTHRIGLKIPIISSAMDTVTESRLAIALAQEGGVGIIHKNMSIQAQAYEVEKVKKFENGMVINPIVASPDYTVGQLQTLINQYHFSGVPIVEDGKLKGLVTSRDMRFVTDLTRQVSDIMTPQSKLVTVKEGASEAEIQSKLYENRIEKILVVNDAFELVGLITLKDIQKATDKPYACKDQQGRLVVGAAVGTGDETPKRIDTLVQAGVDIIVVDTAHGHSKGVIQRVHWVKQNYPDIAVIAGNIATAEAAIALADAGVDAVKVGIGPGSICTTRIVAGVGVPQLTAISNVADALSEKDIPVIADGGIRYSGDICKAIAAGASVVMVGSLFAGTEESPGEVELFQGRSYKSYRGMGSLNAMSKGSSDRYFQANQSPQKFVPEGVEGRVPYKGGLQAVLHQLLGGVRSGMGYTGCSDIQTMKQQAEFVQISSAGIGESHVHNITVTKEPPNYQLRS